MGDELPGSVAYTVVATHLTEESVKRYEAWLRDGHVAALMAGGASGATMVRRDGALVVEVRYRFPSRDVFERYVREVAPTLRAEGLALFGPGSGVSFERSIGVVTEEWGA